MRCSIFLSCALLGLGTTASAAIAADTGSGPRPWLQALRGEASAAPQAALPAASRVERGVRYGDHAAQLLDLYLPRSAQAVPAIVMVHGGGWRIGGRDSPGVATPKAAHWLPRNVALVSVDYRLLPDADPAQQAGDVARALAYLQRHATQWGIDPARIVLMGHSAGAHLVALLGSDPSRLRDAGVQERPLGVVALDSAAMDVPALMQARHLPLYDEAFGPDPAFWQRVSPYHRLARDALPMLAVCSSRRADSCPRARALAERGAVLGVHIEVSAQDLSHMQINRGLGADSAYTRSVDAFVDRLLAPGPR